MNDVHPNHHPTASSGGQAPAEKASRLTRTCAGCQKREDEAQGRLVRIVLGQAPGGLGVSPKGPGSSPRPVVVDVASSAFGRGAHVHPDPACVKKACSGGF